MPNADHRHARSIDKRLPTEAAFAPKPLTIGPNVGGFPVPLAAVVHRRQAGARLHFREPMPSLCHLHPSSPAATVASGFGCAFAFSGVVQKYLIRLVHRGSLWAGGS